MTFRAPGVPLVWSGDRPRCHAAAIPRAGLTLGRDLLETLGRVDDDRIRRQHTQVMPAARSVAKIHATVIERCMIGIRDIDEDSLLVQLRESLLRGAYTRPRRCAATT